MAEGRTILGKSAVLFAARILGSAIAFFCQILIARVWGAETLAHYLLVLAIANVGAALLPLGFQSVGAYFAAEYRARGESRNLRWFAKIGYGGIAAASLVVLAVALLVVPSPLAGLEAQQQRIVTLGLAAAPPLAAMFLNGSILVGLKHPLRGLLPDMLLRPSAFLLPILVLAAGGSLIDPIAGLWTAVAGLWAIAALHTVVLARALPAAGSDRRSAGEGRRWARFAVPWFAIALLSDFAFDLDLMLLAAFLPAETLGVFGVALRILALSGFAVSAIYAVSLPDMFEAGAKQQAVLAASELGRANLYAFAVALAVVIGAVIGGELVLSFFGPEFVKGWPAMVVLLVSLMVRSAFGPASLVLSMHDRPSASLPVLFASIGVLVALNWLLVPAFGLNGAALALTSTVAFASSGLWLVAWRITGKDVSILAALRAMRTTGGRLAPR